MQCLTSHMLYAMCDVSGLCKRYLVQCEVVFDQFSSLWRGLLAGAEIVCWLVLRLRHVHARHPRAFGHLGTHTE